MTRRVHALVAACGAVSSLLCSLSAQADIPAGYTGTPYLGTPRSIPGRIDFEDYDDGGEEVGWRQDDDTGTQFGDGCAGNSYRAVNPHPQICKANGPGEVDTYKEGPMAGGLYPSEAMPNSLYIGYTHVGEWVKLTVDVKQAGTYTLSSTWASEGGGADGIKFRILFNDVLKADVSLPGTGGYHNWVVHNDFAMVELEAGIQVLQFVAQSQHINYDYLQLSLMLPGGGVDDGSGNAGGAGGAGGTDAGGAGGATGGSGGTVEAGGSAGSDSSESGGTAGSSDGSGGAAEAGSSAGGESAASGAPSGASGSSGSSGDGDGDSDDSDGGCSLGHVAGSSSTLPLALLLGAAALARRRSTRAS